MDAHQDINRHGGVWCFVGDLCVLLGCLSMRWLVFWLSWVCSKLDLYVLILCDLSQATVADFSLFYQFMVIDLWWTEVWAGKVFMSSAIQGFGPSACNRGSRLVLLGVVCGLIVPCLAGLALSQKLHRWPLEEANFRLWWRREKCRQAKAVVGHQKRAAWVKQVLCWLRLINQRYLDQLYPGESLGAGFYFWYKRVVQSL